MKKEIKEINKEKGVYQITTTDERWYTIQVKNSETGLPEFKFIPSVTWISGFYPKGIAFYKWLANKGWDEAEALKIAAGDKGSKVHNAIENLIAGQTIKMEDRYMNNSTNTEEELNSEEYEAICSFARWVDDYSPEFLKNEITAISEAYGYAGTIDCICRIKDQLYIVDFKTSQYIWPEMEIQISAYKQAISEDYKGRDFKLAILQLGYKKNKKLYKFTEVDDKFELFLHAKAIWQNEVGQQKPSQKELPLEIKLKKKEKIEEKVEKVVKKSKKLSK